MPALEQTRVLVLAAGRGRRMGGPKALMLVEDEPWWIRQRRRIAEVGIPMTWVVSPQVLYAMRPADTGLGVGDLALVDPDRPMFDSLLAGLSACRSRPPAGVFVLPVDCPAPGPEVWFALGAKNHPAIPTIDGRSGHPVYLPWSFVVSTIDAAVSAPDGREPPRLDLLVRPVARRVPVLDPSVLINLNHPSDVAGWLECRSAAARERGHVH
ncbi:MAG: NTP transferase domain-containing protein [Phycisphaerales bacterium]